ncbi:MAG TPA: hypothetical protein CFH83_11250 [Sulfuricurvum kujiense]|uniref:N-acetyltransferase domain-containing protein n=1 Tax=Sulfuricurvum kujiense TaxID=148813 RepID=A0A2D3WF98_9BACT|nr:hypothetical protein [Sulfuricurvum kujiense]DAB37417.1 MAG TPA: hypothetical protein CFH83_11250 [Sulfuricurvum kujiense]
MITPLSSETLSDFFTSFDFSGESEALQAFIGLLRETASHRQNIIHTGYVDQIPFGFVSLKITNDVDNIPGLLIEFLYVKPEFRQKLMRDAPRYSFSMLDDVIMLAFELQKIVAINHVFLIPVDENKRSMYLEYGFENIPGSGKNPFEDFMVFNLLSDTDA